MLEKENGGVPQLTKEEYKHILRGKLDDEGLEKFCLQLGIVINYKDKHAEQEIMMDGKLIKICTYYDDLGTEVRNINFDTHPEDDISEKTTEDPATVFDVDEIDPFSSEEFGFGKIKKYRDHRTGKRGEGKVVALKAERDQKIVVLRTDGGGEIELPLDDIER